MSEQINYEELLPRQPSAGALDWCIKTKFQSEYAIYRDTYYRDPLTGMKENAVSVACTACGGSWIAEKVKGAVCGRGYAPFGFVNGIMQIGPEDKLQCQQCGAALRAKHIGQCAYCMDAIYEGSECYIRGGIAVHTDCFADYVDEEYTKTELAGALGFERKTA